MESFLEQDFYKFSMQQFILHHFPETNVTYKFYDRNHTFIENVDRFLGELSEEIQKIGSFSLSKAERLYLENSGYFNKNYLDWLTDFKFDCQQIDKWIDNGLLNISISGAWVDTILWEVPLLGAITKAYLRGVPENMTKHYHKLVKSRDRLYDLKFTEFGTRRRRSFEYQDLAVHVLKDAPGFIGTSNVHIARMQNVKFVGTMAHELIMGVSAISGVANANKTALSLWSEFYQGRLGVALTDTFTTKAFLKTFDGVTARVYDGVRQDSGDPVSFAHKVSNHYTYLGINPSHKTIYFSDSLNPDKCQAIEAELDTSVKRVYCLGTHFTNDQKLNLVIKLDTVDGKQVVKLSDEPAKGTGCARAVVEAREALKV